MRITLNENEIKEALVQYVSGHGVDVTGRKVEVSLTAGRGVNGHTADIDILNATDAPIASASLQPAVKALSEDAHKPILEHPAPKLSLLDEVAAMDVEEAAQVKAASIFNT